MNNDKKFYLRLAVENILYEHTKCNISFEDMEEIRSLFNSIIDDFIEENDIVKEMLVSIEGRVLKIVECNKNCNKCKYLNAKVDDKDYPWSCECMKYKNSVSIDRFNRTKIFEVDEKSI